MFKLSQETIAIVTVGLTILGTILYSTGRLEDRIRADIQTVRAEARADREAWQTENARLRDDARADREAWQTEGVQLRDDARADRDAWQAEIRALRADAGVDREAINRLTGIVEEVRTARR